MLLDRKRSRCRLLVSYPSRRSLRTRAQHRQVRVCRELRERQAEHAVAALEEAFAKYGLPEIVNTDQGSQFTSTVFIYAVLSSGIAISMDGKGSWRDKVFIAAHYRTALAQREVRRSVFEGP